MKKRIVIACLLVIAVMLSTVTVQQTMQTAPAVPLAQTTELLGEPTEAREEVKSFWQGRIDEDFDDSSVLVVMDKQTGGINKRHEESFFGEFPKVAVYDLTYMPGDIKSRKYLDVENFHQILQIKLPVASKENVVQVIRQVETIDGILWAGPNHYNSPDYTPPAGNPPNNGNYNLQWGLLGAKGIDAENAWDIEQGTGKVRVGIIDSGIDAHAALGTNFLAGDGGDFVTMSSPGVPGVLRLDPDGHGSAVASVAGASGAQANGIAGVCLNVKLISLQASVWVSSSSKWELDAAAVARAITWATTDIDILNYSAGSTDAGSTPALKDALDAQKAAISNYMGLFVCSAGNATNDNDTTPHYPSDYSRDQYFSDRVISVGAIMEDGTRRSDSNYGDESVSIYAPGNEIRAIYKGGTLYATFGQTSAAAPFVTGVAALLLSKVPNLTAAELKSLILNHAIQDHPISTPSGTQYVKLLNAYNPLNYMDQLAYAINNPYEEVANILVTTASYTDVFLKFGATYQNHAMISLLGASGSLSAGFFDPAVSGTKSFYKGGYETFDPQQGIIYRVRVYNSGATTTAKLVVANRPNMEINYFSPASISAEGSCTFTGWTNTGNVCTRTIKFVPYLSGDYVFQFKPDAHAFAPKMYISNQNSAAAADYLGASFGGSECFIKNLTAWETYFIVISAQVSNPSFLGMRFAVGPANNRNCGTDTAITLSGSGASSWSPKFHVLTFSTTGAKTITSTGLTPGAGGYVKSYPGGVFLGACYVINSTTNNFTQNVSNISTKYIICIWYP